MKEIQKTDETVLAEIMDRVRYARSKHPIFAKSKLEAMNVITEEMDEFIRAVLLGEGEGREYDECRDVIATCFRYIAGEYKQHTKAKTEA